MRDTDRNGKNRPVDDGEERHSPEHSDQFVVSVRVDGEEVLVHRSTGARTDAKAAEFALRSWLLGRDRAPLVGKSIQAVVMASPLTEATPDGR